MNIQSKPLARRLLVAAAILVAAPQSWAAGIDNCNAPPDLTLKGAEMSQKLRRCNSVIKPSKAADPDIIIPAPLIDDPLAIHPRDVPGNKPLAN